MSSSKSSSPDTLSEATLGDDSIISEAVIPPSHKNKATMEQLHQASTSLKVDNIIDTINTDYESSAPEDLDSYPSTKYLNAEWALLAYSRTNKLEKLKALLEAKLTGQISLDLNFKGQQKKNYSWTALHLACYFGHSEIIQELLSNSQLRNEIDVNIQNHSGDTPLHKAAFTNRMQIVQLLLSHDANVFIENCDGLLARQLTSDREIIKMLKAAEQSDRNKVKLDLFKAVDNGDLKSLQKYFKTFGSFHENSYQNNLLDNGDTSHLNVIEERRDSSVSLGSLTSRQIRDNLKLSDETFEQMIDERGNTLLHLATMRGFRAICIYLLEQGFDPYKRNDLGQSCFDLSSYQLRQLFSTVKPNSNHLKRLYKQRVSRFEGPLLKKVRILGWRRLYVVLENGMILLFNNQRDSMNKSRRGYKYLESVTMEIDPDNIGMFTLSFPDRTRATFMVTADHLNCYTSFKMNSTEANNGTKQVRNQIELIRQKWIDSLADHIQYSTVFIRKGLKINDNFDEYFDNEDLSSVNHMLPIDTMKSLVQEARAHYSILERHAESLCSLIQSIGSPGKLTQSVDVSHETGNSNNGDSPSNTQAPMNQNFSTSGRLFGLIKSSKATNVKLIDKQSYQSSPPRKRSESLTTGFIQDDWHCILFHLRLLMESAQNTKNSMGQTVSLIDHQEHIRQTRLQDLEERCRILEESLHTLARDHHELEKSLSMSQIYHSTAARSMSLSTDLNEYYDAFEDFDDERTMTPKSSPSMEDLRRRVKEVIDEENRSSNQASTSGAPRSTFYDNNTQDGDNSGFAVVDEEEVEDDLRSNCSALTMDTVSERTAYNGDSLNKYQIDLPPGAHRTKLPSPMVPRDQISIWSILKNCIGKELYKITMPVVFNEPITMLQRACESIQYVDLLKLADQSDDPVERMEYVCAFIIASLSANCYRIVKPFNPLLYETFEVSQQLDDGSQVRTVAQQVSHHPPISAMFSESDYFSYTGSVNPKIKFWGTNIEIHPDGHCLVHLKRHKENYVFKSVSCVLHNIIVGKLRFEHVGPLDVKCKESKIHASFNFKQIGWLGSDLHRFDGVISGPNKKKLRFIYGKWSDYIRSVDYSEYEQYLKSSQKKTFRIPDLDINDETNLENVSSGLANVNLSSEADLVNNNNSIQANRSTDRGDGPAKVNKRDLSTTQDTSDIPNSRTLWRLNTRYLKDYYNFTEFTLQMNELTPELAKTLPKTDSRFRMDVRKLEEGDLDGAASEKERLEEKQRAARAKDKRFKEPSRDFLWFDYTDVGFSSEKFWSYRGGYWENKCNPDKFPDIF